MPPDGLAVLSAGQVGSECVLGEQLLAPKDDDQEAETENASDKPAAMPDHHSTGKRRSSSSSPSRLDDVEDGGGEKVFALDLDSDGLVGDQTRGLVFEWVLLIVGSVCY